MAKGTNLWLKELKKVEKMVAKNAHIFNMKTDKKPTRFTDKQQLFADQYLVDRIAGKAAIRAGYSEDTADQTASRLLKIPHIKEYIESRKKQIIEKIKVNQEWVVDRLVHLSDYNAEKIQIPMGSGEQTIINTKMRDAMVCKSSTELLGKHLGMFTEKVELTGKDGKELIPATSEERLLKVAKKFALVLGNLNSKA